MERISRRCLMRRHTDQNMDGNGAQFRTLIGSLLLITGIFFLNFISRIVFSPLLPIIELDLGISHGEAGSLFLLISAGYFIALMGSGFLSSRFEHRKCIIFSALALGAVLFAVALNHTLWGLKSGLFAVGMTAGIYLPSGISTLTSLVRAQDWGKAIAIHELAPNIGFVVAPLFSEVLLTWFSWRHVLVYLGVGSISLAFVFARFGRGGRFPGEPPRAETLKILLDEPSFWVMVALFSLGMSSLMGVYSMLPLYLVVGRGLQGSCANYVVGLSRISGLGTVFVSGMVTDRLGPKITLAGVLLGTGLLTILLGVVSGSSMVVMVFLQPLVAAWFFPPGFAALSRVGPKSVRNILVSFTVPAATLIGAGAVPAGIGFLAERELFGLGFCLLGGLIMAGFVLLHFLKFSDE